MGYPITSSESDATKIKTAEVDLKFVNRFDSLLPASKNSHGSNGGDSGSKSLAQDLLDMASRLSPATARLHT